CSLDLQGGNWYHIGIAWIPPDVQADAAADGAGKGMRGSAVRLGRGVASWLAADVGRTGPREVRMGVLNRMRAWGFLGGCAGLALSAVVAAGTFAGTARAQTELTFWSWRQEDRAAYAQFIDAFRKDNPDITVKFEAFEPQSYQTVLSTALAAGKGPDVIQVRAYGNLESVASPGYLLALDEASVPELKGFPQSALASETLRSDGKVYALPFASQTMLVIYNKQIFDENGLKEPETWDELVALCETLKEKGINPFANGTATAWQNETIVGALLSSMIGKAFAEEVVAGKADFTDPRFVDALRKLNEIKQYFAPNFTGVDYAASQQLFAAGNPATFAGGFCEQDNYKRISAMMKHGVFAPHAANGGDERYTDVYKVGGLQVNAKAEQKDAAL